MSEKVKKIKDGKSVLGLINADNLEAGLKDAYHKHTQSVAAAIWTIDHGFGRIPNITAFDENGKEYLISPTHIIEPDGITCNTSQLIYDKLTTGGAICS